MTHKKHPHEKDQHLAADLENIFGPAKADTSESIPEHAETTSATELPENSALEIMQLKQQVADLKEHIKSKEEAAMRALAEAENMRRRCERDVAQARKLGLEKFVGHLLPVVDSLERALETIDVNDEKSKFTYEGIQLTLKVLLDALQKHSVIEINPQGQAFDPAFHEAMSMQEHPDFEPGTVIAVFQKGFQLHERLVRPAKVVVAKANTPKIDERA